MTWADLEAGVLQESAASVVVKAVVQKGPRVMSDRCLHGMLTGLCVVKGCSHGEQWTRMTRMRSAHRRRGKVEPVERVVDGEYQCRGCGEVKQIVEFYANRGARCGHVSRCKVCEKARRREGEL